MTVKLALLKSGEDIISEIKEVVSEDDEKTVAYIFENPFVVKIVETAPELLFEESSVPAEKTTKVSFTPWIPFSSDKKMTVFPDWVVTIVEPTEAIKKSYEDKMNGK